jgi:hypothetical protein
MSSAKGTRKKQTGSGNKGKGNNEIDTSRAGTSYPIVSIISNLESLIIKLVSFLSFKLWCY